MGFNWFWWIGFEWVLIGFDESDLCYDFDMGLYDFSMNWCDFYVGWCDPEHGLIWFWHGAAAVDLVRTDLVWGNCERLGLIWWWKLGFHLIVGVSVRFGAECFDQGRP